MYKSQYTEFIAYESPYIDKIYYMHMNKIIAIIHVDSNWSMHGEVLHPFDMIVKTFGLNQIDCEKLILSKLPAWREDVKRRSKLDRYDSAMLLYKYRGIDMLNNYWFAWSQDDKIEDYHPKYNKEIAEARWGSDREMEDYYTFEMDKVRELNIKDTEEDVHQVSDWTRGMHILEMIARKLK